MNRLRNSITGFSRTDTSSRVKRTRWALLLAALILIPAIHAQAEEPPTAKAWSASGDKGGRLYSMNFGGGSLNDLKQVWMNVFTNDNFLIASPAERVELRAFQVRDMSLTELARSIAFLSHGALHIEVVEGNANQPGNIWRVARQSWESLSQSVKMRAVAAPHLFANNDTLSRFLREVDAVRREMLEASIELERAGSSNPLMDAKIMPIGGQRVFVLVGTESGVSGLESFIKAAEQTAAEPTKEAKGEK